MYFGSRTDNHGQTLWQISSFFIDKCYFSLTFNDTWPYLYVTYHAAAQWKNVVLLSALDLNFKCGSVGVATLQWSQYIPLD